jgi:hypothetical protein
MAIHFFGGEEKPIRILSEEKEEAPKSIKRGASKTFEIEKKSAAGYGRHPH